MSEEEVCFYSVTAFAKLLSISPAGVRYLIAKGEIKSIRLNTAKNSKHRIPKSELYRLNSIAYEKEDESV